MTAVEPVKFGTSGLRGPATGFTPALTGAYGRKALAGTYEFVADQFGDRVPATWR